MNRPITKVTQVSPTNVSRIETRKEPSRLLSAAACIIGAPAPKFAGTSSIPSPARSVYRDSRPQRSAPLAFATRYTDCWLKRRHYGQTSTSAAKYCLHHGGLWKIGQADRLRHVSPFAS